MIVGLTELLDACFISQSYLNAVPPIILLQETSHFLISLTYKYQYNAFC